MKLLKSDYCPFCLRCLLALCEKRLRFDIETVHLPEKARFLEKLSPYGRVPVLEHDGARIFESSVICEYLEDAFPEPALLPRDPAARAGARFWIDFCNARFMPAYFNLLKSGPGPGRERHRAELSEHLRFIDETGLRSAEGRGRFWLGSHFSLVDIAFYPLFERFAAVEEYRDVRIADEHTRLLDWLEAMRERDCVRRYSRPRKEHVTYFRDYYADASSA